MSPYLRGKATRAKINGGDWVMLNDAYITMAAASTTATNNYTTLKNAYTTTTAYPSYTLTPQHIGGLQTQRIAVPPGQNYVDVVLRSYGSGDQPSYRQPPREFNRYINASDLMEEFIGWLGTEGVRAGEVMALPVELFIKWLVIRACEQDHEDHDVVLQLPTRPRAPRCLGCGRFMVAQPVPLHDDACASRYFARAA